jgi:hypothetical protein
MPKATVVIDTETMEPTTADEGTREELADLDISVDDLHVVSEYALLVGVKGLQWLAANSRCHNSRVVARDALAAIGMMGDLPADEQGFPEPVVFEPHQAPDKLPMVQNHYRWLD